MFFATRITPETPRAMPTAAKLIGAVVFFGIGWLAALQVIETFPEGTPATWFPLTIALIGLWQGWTVAGWHAGKGYAIANGLETSIRLALIGLAIFALRTMLLRAFDMRYDGVGEALLAAGDLFVDYGLQSLTLPIWGVLLVGGAIGGLICETVARRWR